MFNGEFMPVNVERFRGRVTWDSSTGLFHITQLNTQDSVEYRVENTEEKSIIKTFCLTVYNRASKPQVNSSQTQAQSDTQTCTLQCSVANGREVTLSWYREGGNISLNHTSSPDLNSTLTVSVQIAGLSIDTYSCEATNPVSTETERVNSLEYCRRTGDVESPISQCAVAPAALALKIAVTAVFSVLTVLAVLTVIRITADLKRLRDQQSKGRCLCVSLWKPVTV
ncbi:SLAM family member 9-like [Amia ocellicauda]|uniref:SLAM family member 9-like n=1 Tax=Amia ocellicauda TaxID=2972642 RepID=UPI00346387B2